MPNLDQLVDLYIAGENSGYVLLPDDYTALGYMAMAVNDYNRVNFVVEQANDINSYLNRDVWQMAKYEDGTYGIR